MEGTKGVCVRWMILTLLLINTATSQQRKDTNHDEGCTSITVGRLASADGSVIVGHTCDGNYRTWLNVVPHQTHPEGSVRQIWWGNLNTETPTDMRGKILKGEIPQVAETYSYLNVAYPCLNGTTAGSLVVGNAEVISALALMQLAHPGAPFIMRRRRPRWICARAVIQAADRRIFSSARRRMC